LKAGKQAIIDGYTLIPVFNYLYPNQYDDVNYKGCSYAYADRTYKTDREETYKDYSPFALQVGKHPVSVAF
jgi:hypothetical protein